MTNKRRLIVIFTALLVSIAIGYHSLAVIYPSYNTEADCRSCHGATADRHHFLVQNATINPLTGVVFQCTDCHPMIYDNVTKIYNPQVTRNCLICHPDKNHTQVHHILVEQGLKVCSDCHPMILNNATNTYSPQVTWDCTTCHATVLSQIPVTKINGPYSGVVNVTINFTGSASGGTPPYSFSWQFGDGVTDNLQNPTHAYTNSGNYTANLTVTDNATRASTSSTKVVVADTFPSLLTLIAGANGPYSGVVNTTINFTGSASGGTPPYSFSWQFGDGATSNLQNPTHVYTNSGNYTANVTVTDNTGKNAIGPTQVVIVGVSLTLIAGANGPYSGIVNTTINFTGSASGGTSPYSFSWQFGDGATSNLQNPTHAYTNSGNYTANLTVTDKSGKKATDSTQVVIVPIPPLALVTEANGPYSGIVNVMINFTGSATGGTPPYSYSWQFGDGSISSLQNPAHAYTISGNYTANLTVTDNTGKKAADSVQVVINPLPLVAGANGPYSGVVNVTINFTGSLSGGTSPYSFSWQLGDGSISSLQNPAHAYTISGNYTANLTVTDNTGKKATDSAQVVINPLALVAGASGPYSGTVNTGINFIGSISGGTPPYSYSWNFGDGTTSSLQNPAHIYTVSGSYTANFTVTDSAGRSTYANALVLITPPPAPSPAPTGLHVSISCSTCHVNKPAEQICYQCHNEEDNSYHEINILKQFTLSNDIYAGIGIGYYNKVNTRHDITASDQNYSSARLTCTDCHSAHLANRKNITIDPDSRLPYNKTMIHPGTGKTVSDSITFCLKCHDNTWSRNVTGSVIMNISKWYSSATGGDTHGVSSGSEHAPLIGIYKGVKRTGNIPAMPCTDCHDPHGSKGLYHLKTLEDQNGNSVTITTKDIGGNIVTHWCSSCHKNPMNNDIDSSVGNCFSCHAHGKRF